MKQILKIINNIKTKPRYEHDGISSVILKHIKTGTTKELSTYIITPDHIEGF